ncbi:MAG TPA: translocation/assembly module TamB domain-containing protein [Candidatus Acidoferrales bacterium]|nr:translocation/assembly module TamB domain-containing protein [Candidatus Acidoferrales bacterium]
MKLRWHHWTLGGLLLVALCVVAVLYVVRKGMIDPWVRYQMVQQIEQRTGGRVELGGFRLEFWRLHVDLDNFTLHGLESASEPPLFHADHIAVGLHIVSFWGRKISLEELIVTKPKVYVRYNASGESNLPKPKVRQTSSQAWHDTLFNLAIGRLELDQGSAVFNDRRVPLDVRGQNLAFLMQYEHPANGDDSYVGSLSWQKVQIAAKHDAPFPIDVRTKFTLHRNSFDLDELVCKLPHSELDARAELASFAAPDWDLHYRGNLSLADIRTIFRKPDTPDGTAEFSGDARYAGGQWTANGYYNGRDIAMHNVWFHTRGMASSGNYAVAQKKLTVANLHASAFGGTVDGRLEMNLDGFAFKTQTHMHGASLAKVFAALENKSFPVVPLDWDSSMDIDSVNTWDAGFKHFRTQGTTNWNPANAAPGTIPVAAQITYDYSADRKDVRIGQSEITDPHLKLDFDGTLGARDSALNVQFHADDLTQWDPFINAIRGPDAEHQTIAGTTTWNGRVLGPIAGPTFVGHVQALKPRYGKYAWDELEADMEYSPDGLRLTNMHARYGGAVIENLSLALQLDGSWGFLPENTWSLSAQVANAPSKDVQEMLGTSYAVTGVFSGNLAGGGTHEDPSLDSDFTFSQISARGFAFDRLAGHVHWNNGYLQLTNADLTAGPGRITGSISYNEADQQAQFDVAGSGIGLDRIAALQSKSLPIGGQFSFNLKGSGPLKAPTAQGDLQLAGLQFGSETEGALTGHLSSDGRNATLTVNSKLTRGKLNGQLTGALGDDVPISGKFDLAQFDLDPFIVAGLHLDKLTGHSSVDGTVALKGSLLQPDTIEADADLSSVSFAYERVQLANNGNVRLSYTRNLVRVEQARLHGTDTDIQIGGTARFDQDRPLALSVAGNVDLRLLGGLLPELETQGQGTLNVSIAGTMSSPRITGRANVKNAAANYADFPVGLSNVNGNFVFDQSRLTFDGLTANAGGGQLKLAGSVTYGEGPMRFDVNTTTSTVRIRYPTGMSWLADGNLRLSGTSSASLLTGSVNVQRVLFAEGVDVASFFAAASETSVAPASNSPFLRNLSFDVATQTAPGSRIEWNGAQIDMDGDVRLRGTWDRPVILGDVHLLGGEMVFRGNNYQLTRGDINFANPFRLDPVLNIEASTTISQYQVTIDFTGPASRLQMNYRSDPPLPDSEIVALLALGNTGESAGLMSGTSSGNYGATALLSEAISSGLGGRIEHLFGISHFSVDPFVSETSTESNAAARVTIEQQVTHDLTITYSTNAATSNQYQMIQVEYAVKRDLSIVFLRDINGTYGMDIKWVKHLK